MLFSTNVLKRYISLDVEPKHLMSTMTLHACEVEHVEQRVIPELVVIGYVTSTAKHPNADTLTICQLDCGSRGTYQICTAADNIRADIFVPVALPWCFLPTLGFQIDARKMRGEDSNGMICAKIEIGINEDADQHGIWIMDEDFNDLTKDDLGKSLTTKYEWLNNTILDVDNKTINNRPDLTWMLGMAIEMKAVFSQLHQRGEGSFIKQQNISHELTQHSPARVLELLAHANKPQQAFRVETDHCSVYSLLELDGITVRKSPFYDRLALIDSGLTPRNNWVDFSNLVMTILGQPIHIFDADTIQGKIVVRQARDGETMIDLNNIEHKLQSQDIVIADDQGVIALAGVIGGLRTAVSDQTKRVVIEIAHFDPVATRRTSMRIGVRTDAVMRFEKTLSPLLSLTAVSFILDLLTQYKPMLGEYTIVGLANHLASQVANYASNGQYITIDPNECIRLIFGRQMNDGDEAMIKDILTSLGFVVEANWDVRVPRWRGSDDMNIAQDLYEEVVRIYGYNRINPVSNKEIISFQPFRPAIAIHRKLEETLVQVHHADQLQTYSRCDEMFFDLFGYDHSQLVKLRNATAPELAYLRPSILPNLLQAVSKNSKIYDEFTLFDSGQTRHKAENYSRFLNKQKFETTKLGIVRYQKQVSDWMHDTILQVKEMIEDSVKALWLAGKLYYQPTELAYYHPKKQGLILYKHNNQEYTIGTLGQYHPSILENLKIDSQAQVVGAELYLEVLEELIKDQTNTFESNATYHTIQDQIVTRDVSFVVDKNVNIGTVVAVAQNVEGVSKVELFDLYQGDRLPAGKKSIALTLTIVGDGTWTSDQINAVVDNVISYTRAIGAEIRS